MGSDRRKGLKRQMAQAHHSVDRALIRIQGLHAQFSEHHPKHTEFLEAIAANLLQSQEMMLHFWRHSWGKLPENLDTYRL